jgi:hypothetical protein
MDARGADATLGRQMVEGRPMTLHLALPLVALLLNVALIAAALAGGGRRPVDRIFAAFASSMVLWNGGVFWLRAAATENEAFFAEVVIHMGVIALPAVYLHFVLAFLDATDSGKRWLRASYAVAAAFAVLNLSGSAWLMRGSRGRTGDGRPCQGRCTRPSWSSSTRS